MLVGTACSPVAGPPSLAEVRESAALAASARPSPDPVSRGGSDQGRTAGAREDEKPAPPADASVRAARARAALPPGPNARVFDPSDGSPYVLALRSEPGAGALFGVVDVRTDPGQLVGRHDFSSSSASADTVLSLRSASGDLVLLARLDLSGEAAACGWWLVPGRPQFVCAPRIDGTSTLAASRGDLIESWASRYPPPSVADPGRTGRVLQLSPVGRWSEIDGFRCLVRPLADVLTETRVGRIRRWQRDTVRRLTRVALHQSRTFEDDRAAGLLRDALEVDACDAEPWRLLGRLQFQRGQYDDATPALAMAVGLRSRDPAPLVDLADALVEVDAATAAGERAWAQTKEILARPTSTRALAAGAGGPTSLAARLYRAYLERTETSAERHRATRRRVEQQLSGLGGDG